MIRSLPGFVSNSKIVREYRRCFDFLAGRFTNVLLVCVPGHSDFLTFFRLYSRRASQSWRAWSSWSLSENSFGTSTYQGSMRSPAPFIDSSRSWWIEGVPTNYLVLGVTSYQLQWPYLQVIALWKDTRREWGSHLTTSAVDAAPLRKRRLLSTFLASARLLLGVDIGYLTPLFLSA